MLLNHDFVETKLSTKFSEFLIRVYPDSYGKETFILQTHNLDVTKPVLVRVHSECLTGDMLGSLHCDCGPQLHKSLAMIKKEGGVLVYLRQEGRGIGLFEKIKTYQLQSKGADTFEANVLLGHEPDQRSYEMVKVVLDDLGISRIRLLTNNPSKISEITKFGIEVVERVPLISKPNKYNKRYLETKRTKFQHFISCSPKPYFYQFNIDKADHLPSILAFVKQKNKDPLLKFGVAISAGRDSLQTAQEQTRIAAILDICAREADCSPSIHFSCGESSDMGKDLEQIRSLWPSVKRLQLNDLSSINMSLLKKAAEHFTLNIPLSNELFPIVHNETFRHFVQKHGCFLLLDNSKGRGIAEDKEALAGKIDILLSYGLNDLFLCGGFGPDHLDTYFELQRHYKINFSIDAESRLKTAGAIDPEKVKIYLLHLLRSDTPNQQGIEQTRKFLIANRRTEWEKTSICGQEFAIHPEVFHAGRFPSTAWFASMLCDLLDKESSFCEVGCGAGAISCLLALCHAKIHITATDINPAAKENTEYNAKQLSLTDRIQAVSGDVLDGIAPNARFDTIFWALPFGFLDPGKHINLEEAQVFDPGYRATRKFFCTAKQHLTPTGRLLIGFSTDLGHLPLLEELAAESGIELIKLREATMKEDSEARFEIFEGKFSH